MKFTIRDMLWATVVAALLVCLSLQWLAAIKQAEIAAKQRDARAVEIEKLRAKSAVEIEELQARLDAAKEIEAMLRHALTKRQPAGPVGNSP